MVKIGDKITVYEILTEELAFLQNEKIMIVNNKKATFDYLNKMVVSYRGANRINKPIYVTFYTDWKNNKITKDSYNLKKIVVVNKEVKEFIDNMEITN